MRKTKIHYNCRKGPCELMVQTIINGKVKFGHVDVEVRIGPVVGESEYIVLTRLPGQKAWSESWRLGELAGFKDEFTRTAQPIHYQRYIAAISGLVDRAAKIEAGATRKAA